MKVEVLSLFGEQCEVLINIDQIYILHVTITTIMIV